ncbi:MAG: M28 family peptidase [Treponema sp.]|nr:M28 family peptidase [Treponema sp.]
MWGWSAESPYDGFFDFIDLKADRYGILLEQIEKLKLNSAVISINGNRHFFIFPSVRSSTLPAKGALPSFRGQSPVILTAHYDRVQNSPGANDNSAAVFFLLKAAQKLKDLREDHWIIIFTDKEELKAGDAIQDQGSFSLAEKLLAWGLGGGRIFNFDVCGTGDTFIISSTTDYLLKKISRREARKTKQQIDKLREHALNTARHLRLNKVLLLPTPFSDDAGFLRAGIPAQTITMLPSAEASPYAALVRSRPNFADCLISGTAQSKINPRLIPETWRTINGPSDSYLRLTPQFFDRVVRFAAALCR